MTGLPGNRGGMMWESPTVRLELSSKSECISLVRGMLSGIAEALGFDAELLDDLKTAVSEACNNVVLHAYEEGPGPLLVTLVVDAGSIEVTVRDWGRGIHQVTPSEDRLHVGLALISALADRSEFVSAAEGGAEVRMEFHRPVGPLPVVDGAETSEESSASEEWRSQLLGDVVVTLSPVTLLSGVLGRLTRALAAGSRFTLDRFSDLYLVTDALSAHAAGAARSPRISFAVLAGKRRLEMTIGPFSPGASRELSAGDPDGQSLLAMLTDELTVEPTDSSELLRLVLQDGSAANAITAQ
jgi:anti-sigma regulatory factor (Ser/Thr protein kinase)